MTWIAVACSSPTLEQHLREAVADQPSGELYLWHGDTPQGPHTAEDFAPPGTEVVVLGPGLGSDAWYEIAASIDALRPEVSVVLIADRTADVLDRALRTGIREVVPPEADAPTLREAFTRALERSRARAHSFPAGPTGASVEETGPTIITVASPKGGAGKTIIATNLAIGLAARRPGQVALVDLDLQFGDVATGLGLLPQHTVADLLRFSGPLDATAAKAFLTPHPTSLHALCAPLSPGERDDISAEMAQRVVQTLGSQFPFVVVDTAAGLDEHALAALEISTDCVFVATMDVPSVRSLRKELEVLAQLGLDGCRRHLVVNRSDTGLGLDTKDVEVTVGLPAEVVVSSNRAVQLSMNQGVPVLQSDPRSPVGRQLETLVDRFATHASTAPKRFPLFRRAAT